MSEQDVIRLQRRVLALALVVLALGIVMVGGSYSALQLQRQSVDLLKEQLASQQRMSDRLGLVSSNSLVKVDTEAWQSGLLITTGSAKVGEAYTITGIDHNIDHKGMHRVYREHPEDDVRNADGDVYARYAIGHDDWEPDVPTSTSEDKR